MPLLIKGLSKQFWNLHDQHLIYSAVEDALIDYFVSPAQFDPVRAGLSTYLHLRAKSLLLNILAQEKSHQEKAVEVGSAESVYKVEAQEDSDIEVSLTRRDASDQTMQQLRLIFTNPIDLEMVVLMMDNVRDTHRFAELLGILDQSLEDQKSIVKRHKDRLKKTVQRKYKRGS